MSLLEWLDPDSKILPVIVVLSLIVVVGIATWIMDIADSDTDVGDDRDC